MIVLLFVGILPEIFHRKNFNLVLVVIRMALLTDFLLPTAEENLYKHDNLYKVFTMEILLAVANLLEMPRRLSNNYDCTSLENSGIL